MEEILRRVATSIQPAYGCHLRQVSAGLPHDVGSNSGTCTSRRPNKRCSRRHTALSLLGFAGLASLQSVAGAAELYRWAAGQKAERLSVGTGQEMHYSLWSNLIPFSLLSIGVIPVLARALELRQEQPEFLRNFLSFLFLFLLAPMFSLFALALLPLFGLVALGALFLPTGRTKAILLWASSGGAAGTVAGVAYIAVLNTFTR